ncbi:hypothetical protein [Methanimicrococcus stummii]|uniref:hypothetical protein n=1 Tax=Methanimicrococcus stummii TaxID=3028294 RepID=UPI00292F94B9|nr:hypothetical protein [Methanimicrococcus sp. Es2]
MFAFIFISATIIPVYAEEGIWRQNEFGEWELSSETINATPPTDPSVLRRLENQNDVLAVYGEIPQINGKDAHDRRLAVEQTAKAVAGDDIMREYQERGLVIGIGAIVDGYVVIEILEEKAGEFEPGDIELLKTTADKYAEIYGILNLPLVFQAKQMPYGFEMLESETKIGNQFTPFLSSFNFPKIFDSSFLKK